jgi:hypothetical protein
MPGAIPVVEDMPGEVPSSWGAGVSGAIAGGGVGAGASAALGPSEGNNTHLWVAALMLGALVLVVGLHISGFRFATDVGITRG